MMSHMVVMSSFHPDLADGELEKMKKVIPIVPWTELCSGCVLIENRS